MMMLHVYFLVLLCAVSCYGIFHFNKIPIREREPVKGNVGKPLFLTPLLQQGRIEEAQTKSKVHLKDFPDLLSYSGLFTVDEAFNSNLFFWFFPSEGNWRTDPIVLWLQGGPGASSLLALFTENGPIEITVSKKAKRRNYSWTDNHSVLYIDSPVGTGFSFTNENGYSTNETAVGGNLYNAILQFFTLFPYLRRNEFFVFGESYGGKYVPAISHTILKNDPNGELIHWQGSAIGNGLTDPINQLGYGEYLYQHGLIDWIARKEADRISDNARAYIRKNKWEEATNMFDQITNFYLGVTGLSGPYNYYNSTSLADMFTFLDYLESADVRRAIHVGNLRFSPLSNKVYAELSNDMMKSVESWVSEILEHRRLLVYNGQLDIICAYPMTVNYLRNLKFSSAKVYRTAPRYQWVIDGLVAGYVKTAGNLTELLVRDAGHLVPHDQPRAALDLVTRFTRNIPFS